MAAKCLEINKYSDVFAVKVRLYGVLNKAEPNGHIWRESDLRLKPFSKQSINVNFYILFLSD